MKIDIIIREIERAKDKGDYKAACLKCQILSSKFESQGDHEGALRWKKENLRLCEILNDDISCAEIHRSIQESYFILEKYDRAIFHCNQYLEMAKRAESQVEIQRALATFGKLYLDIFLTEADSEQRDNKFLEKAKNYFFKSFEIVEKLKSTETTKAYSEMKARLLINLGLVCEESNDLAKCITYLREALILTKKFSLPEDLLRCQRTLCTLYIRLKQYSTALPIADEAISTARSLNDNEEMSEFLFTKFQLLCKLDHLLEAKKAIKEAEKLKPGHYQRELKIVTSLCRSKLELEKGADEFSIIRHYENMGDGFATLLCYDLAIEYYSKILERIQTFDLPDSKLASIYYSLGLTYWDKRDSQNALKYLFLELELHKNNLLEKFRTLTRIIQILKETDSDRKKLRELLHSAYIVSQELGESKVRLCLQLMRETVDVGSLDANLQQAIATMPDSRVSSDDEDEEGDSFDQVVLTESDNSDEECPSKRVRCRRSQAIVRKNDLGETPLHLASKKGNLNAVRNLVENGHPVNVRDNTGWLPLHEACNFGHADVVEYLLEHGAWVNDQEGKVCDRISPLIDAASGGHIDCMKVLLKKGADVNAKTVHHETALDYLKEYKASNPEAVDSEFLELEKELERRTIVTKVPRELINSELRKKTKSRALQPENEEPKKKSPLKQLFPSKENAVEEYAHAIQNLKRPQKSLSKSEAESKKNALISEDSNVVDNWLIDDIGKPAIKSTKRIYSGSPPVKTKKKKKPHRSSQNDVMDSGPSVENLWDSPVREEVADPVAPAARELFHNDDDDMSSLPTQEYTSPPPASVARASFCLRVNIKEVNILVPVATTSLTIRWLETEAARRYYEINGIKPILSLSKMDGALLSPSDIIESVLVHNEVVRGAVERWELPPLRDRYKEACLKHGVPTCADLLEKFSSVETSAHLSLSVFSCSQAKAVFQCLHFESGLKHLSLEGSLLGEEETRSLAACLPLLSALQSLSLASCNLTPACAEILAALPQPLDTLDTLNLSFNPLGNESATSLAGLISRCKNLRRLQISGCSFTQAVLEDPTFAQTLQRLKLHEFGFCHNSLTGPGLGHLLELLSPADLACLSLSNSLQGCGELLAGYLGRTQLKRLHLKGCKLLDRDLQVIKEALAGTPNLQELDLSANPGLSWELAEELFQSHPYCSFNLAGSVVWDGGQNIPPSVRVTFTSSLSDRLNNLVLGPGHLVTTPAY